MFEQCIRRLAQPLPMDPSMTTWLAYLVVVIGTALVLWVLSPDSEGDRS